MTRVSDTDRSLIGRLRQDLLAADYFPDRVTAMLGGQESQQALLAGVTVPAEAALQQAAAAANTAPARALTTLCAVLQLGAAARGAQLAAALPTLTVPGAVALGLLRPVDPAVSVTDPAAEFVAALSLNPVAVADTFTGGFQEWWLLSDLDDHLRRGPAAADFVMGVGGASRSLLQQAPATAVQLAADMGTGCGIIALHLALRASRVIATDISERALRFAELNAVLNQVTNIDFRQGDLFHPFGADRVDLLLTNPPFVIEPDSAESLVYRSGSGAGDSLAAQVVSQMAGVLRPGGEAVALVNWENRYGDSYAARPAEWLRAAAAGCPNLAAAWVIEREQLSPLGYAQMWARDGGLAQGSAAASTKIAKYLQDFKQRQVASVSLGAVRVRAAQQAALGAVYTQPGDAQTQPGDAQHGAATADAAVSTNITQLATAQTTAAPLVHICRERGALAPAKEAGRALTATFDTALTLAQLSDTELLGRTLVVAESVLEQRIHSPGAADPQQLVLLNSEPFMQHHSADTLLTAALGACDGELTVAQIVGALAQIFKVDPAAVAAELLPQLRDLAWLGFLRLPAAEPQATPVSR